MASDRPIAIAIDLGGTQVRAALFAADKMLKRAALPTDISGGPTAVLHQMESLVEQISEGIDIADCAGIGLSTAGPVDTQAGVILGIPTLPGWQGFPILSTLKKRFGLPVYVENDAIASALGEWRHGAGRNIQNLVYVTVSTGIGGGAVVDGRLLHGRMGMVAHVGHMRLAQQGPTCGCGAIGCFEAFASGTALAKRASIASRDQNSAYLGEIAKNGIVGAVHVFDGAKAGDNQCIALVEEEAKYLGQGITSLIHLFSPERVILGGGVSEGFDMLQTGIHTLIKSDAMDPFKQVPVVRSELGDNSGLIGAATMVLDHTAFG